MKNYKHLFDLFLLYAGKLGGILLTIVFIPIYRRHLTADQFGLVSILLSLQMIVYVLDFGYSIDLSRQASQALAKRNKLKFLNSQYQSANLFLKFFYFTLALVFLLLKGSGLLLSEFPALCVLIILAIVIFNLKTSILLASQKYKESSLYQLASSLLRGAASAGAVVVWHESLLGFAIAQLVIMLIINMILGKVMVNIVFDREFQLVLHKKIKIGLLMLRRCLPLFLTVGIGALCSQADRFVILGFGSAAAVGNYFLAATYSLTPIILVAQPLFQYFYPKMVAGFASDVAIKNSRIFSAVLAGSVLLSCFFLTTLAKPAITIWLGGEVVPRILPFISILLFASALSALSFGSYSLMLCVGLYEELKKVSFVTVVVYGFGLLAATILQSLEFVCIAFAFYNLATLVSQTYFCLKNEKCKTIMRVFIRDWLSILPMFIILLVIAIFGFYTEGPFTLINLVLLGTLGYGLLMLWSSLRGLVDVRGFKTSIDRSSDT
jgi:O-antigen/teichoic acid export membrane protein